MDSSIVFLLIVFLSLSFSSDFKDARQPLKDQIQDIDIPVYTGCGGVIPVTTQRFAWVYIDYKSDKPYDTNEFCVWTILPDDNVDSVTLSFTQLISDGWDGFVIYTWDKTNLLTSLKITDLQASITLNTTNIAIAFSSDFTNQANGFQIIIDAKNGFGPTKQRAYFLNQDQGEFKYPLTNGQDSYDRDEQVSVVLHGQPQKPMPFREYVLKNIDTENQHDFIDAYVLLPYEDDYALHYRHIGRFSGQYLGYITESKIVTPFPVLFLFSSDRKVNGKGFAIEWRVFENVHATI